MTDSIVVGYGFMGEPSVSVPILIYTGYIAAPSVTLNNCTKQVSSLLKLRLRHRSWRQVTLLSSKLIGPRPLSDSYTL